MCVRVNSGQIRGTVITSEKQNLDDRFLGAVLNLLAGQPEFDPGSVNCFAVAPKDRHLFDFKSNEI